MPAITRSQSALKQSTALKQVQQVQVSVVADEYTSKKSAFINKVKPMMDEVRNLIYMADKMEKITEIYRIINREFSSLYKEHGNKSSSWLTFASCIFTRSYQFEDELRNAPHYKFSSELLDAFNKEIGVTRQFCVGEAFMTDNDLFRSSTNHYVVEARNLLDKILSGEKKQNRSVKRVNYVEMDSDEEENVISDPDYVFEEEEDDEEPSYADSLNEDEEEEEDEDKEVSVCKRRFENGKVTYRWSKMPLSQLKEIEDPEYVPDEEEDEDEEEEVINYTAKLRQRKELDYSGMDMNEDDEGEFKFSKKMMDDGELIHYWVTVPLSQINDYDDEDYVYEEDEEDEN
jgi:hypothetical protein